MISLGVVPGRGRLDRRRDRTLPAPRCVDARDDRRRRRFLLRRLREDCRAILRPDVVPLAIERRGIVQPEEPALEQFLVGEARRDRTSRESPRRVRTCCRACRDRSDSPTTRRCSRRASRALPGRRAGSPRPPRSIHRQEPRSPCAPAPRSTHCHSDPSVPLRRARSSSHAPVCCVVDEAFLPAPHNLHATPTPRFPRVQPRRHDSHESARLAMSPAETVGMPAPGSSFAPVPCSTKLGNPDTRVVEPILHMPKAIVRLTARVSLGELPQPESTIDAAIAGFERRSGAHSAPCAPVNTRGSTPMGRSTWTSPEAACTARRRCDDTVRCSPTASSVIRTRSIRPRYGRGRGWKTRAAACSTHFRADPDEYVVIFTANASHALKLVAESYPFTRDSRFLLTADNHNSVNGIREFARALGASTIYLPLDDDMRVSDAAVSTALTQRHGAFARPVRLPGTVKLFRRAASAGVDCARAIGWLGCDARRRGVRPDQPAGPVAIPS